MNNGICNKDNYRGLARFYDSFFTLADMKDSLQFILQICAKYLDEKAANVRVADLACGTGRLTIELLKYFAIVYGLDLSFAMLEELKEKRSKLGQADATRLELIQADISDYVLAEAVDVLLCMTDGLNHLNAENVGAFLATSAENLHSGGLLIFDLLQFDYLAKVRGSKTFFRQLGNNPVGPDYAIVWENHWNKTSASSKSVLTIFQREQAGNQYKRSVDTITEYFHDLNTVSYLWEQTFETLETMDLPERRYFVLRKL